MPLIELYVMDNQFASYQFAQVELSRQARNFEESILLLVGDVYVIHDDTVQKSQIDPSDGYFGMKQAA